MQILSEDVTFNPDAIIITIDIIEGEQNFYNKIDFDGNYKFSNEDLLETLSLIKGEVFNEELFNRNFKFG